MANRKKIIVANWKMNPRTVIEAVKIFDEIRTVASKLSGVQTVICPPAIFIDTLKKRMKGHRCSVGAQDVSTEKGTGAHTGEVSTEQLLSVGVQYVIVGHSERRARGETNEMINEKLTGVLKNGLQAILCVGELARDSEGEYLREVAKQIVIGLRKIHRRYLLNLTIAYEPVWAVGANSEGPATPQYAHEMAIFIRKVIAEIAGTDLAHNISIIYGGSATPIDAWDFMTKGGMSGLLVGRESLKSKNFSQILAIAHATTKKN